MNLEEDRRCKFFNATEKMGMPISDAKLFYNTVSRLVEKHGKEFVTKLLTNDNFSKGISDAIHYTQGWDFIINQWEPIKIGVIPKPSPQEANR